MIRRAAFVWACVLATAAEARARPSGASDASNGPAGVATAVESESETATESETAAESETGGTTLPATVASDARATSSRPIDLLPTGLEDAGLGHGAWVSVGVFGGEVRDDAISLATVDFGLRLAISAEARASLDWGLAHADARVRGAYTSPTLVEPFNVRRARLETRNADFRFDWMPRLGPDVRLGVGLGAAIPIAATSRLPSDAPSQADFDASVLAHEAYLASRVGLRAWRYRPERAAIYLPVAIAIAPAEQVLLVVEAAAALGLRVLGGMGEEFLGDLLLSADLGISVLPELRLGARGSLAGLALGTRDQAAQPSAEAWARIELRPVSVLVRASLGIGGPYGLGSNFAGWGAHAGASVAF